MFDFLLISDLVVNIVNIINNKKQLPFNMIQWTEHSLLWTTHKRITQHYWFWTTLNWELIILNYLLLKGDAIWWTQHTLLWTTLNSALIILDYSQKEILVDELSTLYSELHTLNWALIILDYSQKEMLFRVGGDWELVAWSKEKSISLTLRATYFSQHHSKYNQSKIS